MAPPTGLGNGVGNEAILPRPRIFEIGSNTVRPDRPSLSTLLLLVFLPFFLSSPATAADDFGRGFALSFGYYDFDDPLEAVELGVDYRFEPIRWGLVPHVGLHATEDETVFGYVGLRRNFELSARWLLTPSFEVSLHDSGDGKDLGHVIEFRSGMVLGRRLVNGGRVGVGFYHLSNSSLSATNPGANSVLLRYVFPPRKRSD